MRDIRDDLKERLRTLDADYADEMARYTRERQALDVSHYDKTRLIEGQRNAIEALMRSEDERAGSSPTEVRNQTIRMPLADFIITQVFTHGSMSKEQIHSEASAAGYLDEATARTLHITLMNVTKAGKLFRLPNGRYEHPIPNTLFGVEQSEEGSMPRIM